MNQQEILDKLRRTQDELYAQHQVVSDQYKAKQVELHALEDRLRELHELIGHVGIAYMVVRELKK